MSRLWDSDDAIAAVNEELPHQVPAMKSYEGVDDAIAWCKAELGPRMFTPCDNHMETRYLKENKARWDLWYFNPGSGDLFMFRDERDAVCFKLMFGDRG